MSRETISDLVKSRVPCPVGHPACHNARSIPPRIRNLHLHLNIAGQQLRTPGIDSPGVGGSPGHRPEGVSRACGPHRAPARQAHERRASPATRPAGVSDARHCPQARFRHGTCGRSRYRHPATVRPATHGHWMKIAPLAERAACRRAANLDQVWTDGSL